MCINYLFFYRALKSQFFDRDTLPYKGYFQPWSTWIALSLEIMILGAYGYSVFLPGAFSVADFLSYYAMIFVALGTFSFWKLVMRSKRIRSTEADLVWERPKIDRYEEVYMTEEIGFWRWCRNLIGKARVTVHRD